MKIAFDENVPIKMVRLFKALTAQDALLPHIEIVSARDYTDGHAQHSDVPWLEAFGDAGGQVVITGDTRIRSRPHERKAFRDANLIVFFFASKWSRMPLFPRSAMLINWWPQIEQKSKISTPKQCWQIPAVWETSKPMRDVTGPSD